MTLRLFSEEFEKVLKKSHIGYDVEKFTRLILISSVIGAILLTVFFFFIFTQLNLEYYFLGIIFLFSFLAFFFLVKLIPTFSLQSKKAMLESDLLYSTRHLLLKLESGSSLVNSLESVSELSTSSAVFFKEIVFDITMGVPVEDVVDKAIEYSPSKAYTKILEEIQNSLKTGADIQKSLKSTLEDITKQHLIQIEAYGKKLNPMSMFYMIIGTIVPSLGTAMLVVASSLLPGAIIIDKRILLFLAMVVLVIQIFFILGFKSLKPGVME